MLSLASCGGHWQPEPVSDSKLDATYLHMLVLPVDIGGQFAIDYPQAASDCRSGLIERLLASKRFQVRPVDAPPALVPDRQTLVIKLAIIECSIVNRWVAWQPASYIIVRMTLIDGHSGLVIRDKEFSTKNNTFAAGWSHTDAAIPKDMGSIIGDYITAVVPPAL